MDLEPTSPRGVSEGTGVAVLVVITVVATASVGMTVTFVMDDSGEYGAEFTFDYYGDLEHLLIFYDDGDPLRAGSIYISGPSNEVTWAELEEVDPDEMIEPSNVPTRLSDQNAYDAVINEGDFVEIRYVPEDEREGGDGGADLGETEGVVLATWNDPSEAENGGPVDVPES